jgi:thymidine phosphorylase
MVYFSTNFIKMKKAIFSFFALTLFLAARAQSGTNDTSLHASAIAVCNCLEKANITDKSSEQEMQMAFLNCITTSAPELIAKIASSGEDFATAGQEIGTKLAMEMLKNGCPAFAKIAGAMAMSSGDDSDSEMQLNMPSQVETETVESTDGVVTKVEERDFTYITVKTTAGRELTFIYYRYVPGSDDWIKNATIALKNKKVALSYVESEVYQPKFKQFMNVKEIKTLTIK